MANTQTTNESIVEAAKAAGLSTLVDALSKTNHHYAVSKLGLERFAQIIRNQALEDAAKCCDERAMKNEHACDGEDEESATSLRSAAWQISVCAATIRAMKKDQP